MNNLKICKIKAWREILGDVKVEEFIVKQLVCIESKYKLNTYDTRVIIYFIKYHVNNENIEEQFIKYRNIKNKKANSLENNIIRYGENIGREKYEQDKKLYSGGLHNFIRKYGEKEGKERYERANILKLQTRESYIVRYGEDVGNRKWDEFVIKCGRNLKLERHIELYGEEEGKKSYNEMRKKYIGKGTEKYWISKYGEEEGKKIYGESVKRLRYVSSEQYMIDIHGEKHGKKLWKQYKNNTSLDSFKRRYGEIVGQERFDSFKRLNLYKRSVDYYISTYGEKEGIELYEAKKSKINNFSSPAYSKISQKLFNTLRDMLEHKSYLYYATHNNEYVFYDKFSENTYFLDFVDLKNKKCIEFNGDIFHGNPEIFLEGDRPNPWDTDLTCEKMWIRDDIKIDAIKRRGLDVLVVWEKDYRQNSDNVIQLAYEFITNG